MIKMKKEDLKEQEEDLLSQIAPSRDEFINRRIRHINFARTIIFICIKSRNNDFIYSSDLSEFLKVSTSRANQILNDFANMNLLKKRFPTSTLVEFWIEKENEDPIIINYFEKAKKTLGIEFKLTVKKEE